MKTPVYIVIFFLVTGCCSDNAENVMVGSTVIVTQKSDKVDDGVSGNGRMMLYSPEDSAEFKFTGPFRAIVLEKVKEQEFVEEMQSTWRVRVEDGPAVGFVTDIDTYRHVLTPVRKIE